MLASYRVHEMRVSRKRTPGLSVLRTKVFRSLIACKTFYRQTCAKTSPILLFWPCSMTASHSKTVSSVWTTYEIDPYHVRGVLLSPLRALQVQPKYCGFTNLSVAGLDNNCKSSCEALLWCLASHSQLRLVDAIFRGSYGSTGSFVYAQHSG